MHGRGHHARASEGPGPHARRGRSGRRRARAGRCAPGRAGRAARRPPARPRRSPPPAPPPRPPPRRAWSPAARRRTPLSNFHHLLVAFIPAARDASRDTPRRLFNWPGNCWLPLSRSPATRSRPFRPATASKRTVSVLGAGRGPTPSVRMTSCLAPKQARHPKEAGLVCESKERRNGAWRLSRRAPAAGRPRPSAGA